MEVLVRNADGNLSNKHREYAAKKLGKLDRYFHAANKIEIVHREENHQHRIEITVFADGHILRGEESDESVQAAIDLVADKMENRLRRLKNRLVKSHRRGGRPVPEAFEEVPEEPQDNSGSIEFKSYDAKPMGLDEAILQMELVDHPFYVFRNEKSGEIEVLYKRKSGSYGVLSPEA